MHRLFLALTALFLAGCATLPAGKPDARDPWEKLNRKTYAFNDALDRAVARPAAKAYVKVTPRIVRTGIRNVFSNLNNVGTIINDALQGKMRQAGRDSARFLMNSTIGLGGLFDPASAAGLEYNDEDFGQTLGKWGVKSGPYFVIPFLGPSTARDAVARIPDQYTNPVTYLEDDSTRYIIRGVDLLDTRAGLLDLEPQLERTYDKYAFVRNAWLQRREFQVTDGEIEDPSLELEEDFGEEPAPDAEPTGEDAAGDAAGETPPSEPAGDAPPPGEAAAAAPDTAAPAPQ